jgi:hypothetical protein
VGCRVFTQGIDVAVAYGADVSTRRQSSAVVGVQGDHGIAVATDHEGGRQTRYAPVRRAARAGRRRDEGRRGGEVRQLGSKHGTSFAL